jgi:hypothetical protein
MRINDVLTENQLDEISLAGLGKAATTAGKAVGSVPGGIVQGAKNFWQGAKQGYSDTKNAMKNPNAPVSNTHDLGSALKNVVSKNSTTRTPGTNTEVDQILRMVSKLNPETKNDLLSKLQPQSAQAPQPSAAQANTAPETPAEQPTAPTPNYSGGHTQGNVSNVNYSFNATPKPASPQGTSYKIGSAQAQKVDPMTHTEESVGYSRFLGISL